jgi:predicted acetyltransferase
MRLVLERPTHTLLPGYVEALSRSWSSSNLQNTSAEELAAIAADPQGFLDGLESTEGTIALPDGRRVPKLPSRRRWMFDGEFCGSISLRFVPGTDALPEHVLGHVGYAVVPWKRRRGSAREAVRLMLDEARLVGLRDVSITTDPENRASVRVIEANGGCLVRAFVAPDHGPQTRLLYRIPLEASTRAARDPTEKPGRPRSAP